MFIEAFSQTPVIPVKKSLHTSQVAHQAGAYPGFCSMKRLGVFLLPPRWDASPSQVTPSSKFAGTHLYTWVERGTMGVKCLAQEHNTVPRPGVEPGPFDPESSALTIRPSRLPVCNTSTETILPLFVDDVWNKRVTAICNTPPTLVAAFDLLVALCRGCVQNLRVLADTLTDFYYSGKS